MGSKMKTEAVHDLFEVAIQPDKEIFTVKKDKVWYGVINTGDKLYMTVCSFDSALQAANKARALKKSYKIEARVIQKPEIKKIEEPQSENLKKPKVTSSKRKIVGRRTELFDEEAMSSLANTGLKFREVWVIRDRKTGKFVHKSLSNNSVADYCDEKEFAEVHKSFEEAVNLLKTLNGVIGPGHELRRYWAKNS